LLEAYGHPETGLPPKKQKVGCSRILLIITGIVGLGAFAAIFLLRWQPIAKNWGRLIPTTPQSVRKSSGALSYANVSKWGAGSNGTEK
jgi:hypothetical protein